MRWKAQLSDQFHVSNGVKQGGILSPVLFSIYTDVMLRYLRGPGVGCYVGHHLAGALAYADDVVILAPSRSALESILAIASLRAADLSLKFNGAKSQYLHFCSDRNSIPNDHVIFCGVDVPRVSEGLHLGNLLGTQARVNSVKSAACDLHRRTNVLLTRFAFCTPEVRYKLFKAHCVIAHGSQLWDFDSSTVNDYFTAWKISVRRVWKLPNTTRSYILHGICRDHDIESQLISRSIKFIRSAVKSSNSLYRFCGLIALRGSGSAVSNTISRICSKYSISRHTLNSTSERIVGLEPTDSRVGAIRDFRLTLTDAVGEDREYIEDILYFLYTDRNY